MEHFYYLLSTTLKSGMDIRKSLENGMDKSCEININLRESIINDINSGKKLSDSLKHTAHISDFDFAVISAGEYSGALPESLMKLSEIHRQIKEERLILIKSVIPSILGFMFLILALCAPYVFTCGFETFLRKVFFFYFISICLACFVYLSYAVIKKKSSLLSGFLFNFDNIFLPNIYRYKSFHLIFFLFYFLYKSGYGYSKIFNLIAPILQDIYSRDKFAMLVILSRRELPLQSILGEKIFFDKVDSERLIMGEQTGTLDIELKRLYETYENKYNSGLQTFYKTIGNLIYSILVLTVAYFVLSKLSAYFEIVSNLLK